MSKWIDRFNSHALIGVWSTLLELTQDEELVEKSTEGSIEDIARLRKVICYLNGIFESIDPEITPFNQLTNIQKTAQGCINEINAYKGNRNAGHLKNANSYADTLMIQFQQIPASVNAVSPKNIRESVSEYSKTIGSYISKYKNETEESVRELALHINDVDKDIEEKESKLAGLAAKIENVEQTIHKQASEFNTQYQQSEKIRSERFEKELSSYSQRSEEIIEKYKNKADEEFNALSLKAIKIIEVLNKLQDDASKVYGVTINTLQAGAYSAYANEEKKVANRYRLYASCFMLFGVGFLVLPEFLAMLKDEGYIFDWVKLVGRIPLSLVLFVPAFYFAKESGKHRLIEIANRRRQHILTTLDPYIELMDPNNAEELRVHVAKTVFSENYPGNNSKENEMGSILASLASVAKQIKGG